MRKLQQVDQRLLRTLPEFQAHQWLLYPDDWLMDLWGGVMSVLMLYTATVLPYRVAFLGAEHSEWTNWEYALDVCFGLDVCFNSVLAYYDEEMSLVVSRRRVFMHYLATWMVPDIASAVPLELLLSMQSYNSLIRLARLPRVYKLIKLAKLLRMLKVVKNRRRFLRSAKTMLRISLSLERLLGFLVWLLLLIHLFACCWVFFAKFDEEDPENWVICRGYADYTNWQLYVTAVYFAVATLSTVGYGDITPCNSTERVVCSVMMLVGVFVYSVTIGCLTSLLGSLDKRRVVLDKRIELLAELSHKYHFTKPFFNKLSQSVEYEQRNSQKDLNDLFTCLPSTLRTQLLTLTYCQLLESNAFFTDRTEHFVAWVAPRLSPVRIVASEFIYHEKEPAAEMYFVVKGEVEYVLPGRGRKEAYHVVRTNYYFGEEDLLLSDTKLHQFSTKTASKSEFLVLSKADFDDLLVTFDSESIEIFAMTEKRRERILEHKFLAENRLKANRLVIRHETTPAKKAEIHSAVTEFVIEQRKDRFCEDSSEENGENRKEIGIRSGLLSADVLLLEPESENINEKVEKAVTFLEKKEGKLLKGREIREIREKVSRIESKFDVLSEMVLRIAEQLGTNMQPFASYLQSNEGVLDAIAETEGEQAEK